MRLVFMKQQRQQAELDLLNNLDTCPEKPFLLSMFGLGPINAARILAHIGDISQYSSVKQLSKLAGIVPIQNESAGHTGQKTPMSKKGRNGLRAVTYRSVVSLLRHNQGFIKYVKNLQNRSGGNHPLRKREALGAAMNKLLRIIYALLVKRQPFDLAQAFAA
jgi:transposase